MKNAPSILLLGVLSTVAPAHGQVTVDVGKITCEQYLAFAVADPRDIAIWLSGYYHGKQGNTILEPQKLKENAERLQSACFQKTNAKLPVMQVIGNLLGPNNLKK